MFLSHFGEIPPPSNPTYGIDGCGRCDNCNLSPEEVSSGQEDFGKEARLLLSVVDALRGSYGITMYVEILRGKVGWGPLPMVNAFSFPVSLNTHKQPPPPFCTFPKLLPSSGCKETAEGCQLGTAGRSVRSRRKSSKHSRKFLSPVSTAHPLGGGGRRNSVLRNGGRHSREPCYPLRLGCYLHFPLLLLLLIHLAHCRPCLKKGPKLGGATRTRLPH